MGCRCWAFHMVNVNYACNKSSLRCWAFQSLASTGCRVGERKCWCLTRRGWSFTLLTFHLKLELLKSGYNHDRGRGRETLGVCVCLTLNFIPLISRHNGENHGQCHLEKTISLGFQYLFVCSAERHLFLYHGGSTSLDARCFSPDVNTFQLDRVCSSKTGIYKSHTYIATFHHRCWPDQKWQVLNSLFCPSYLLPSILISQLALLVHYCDK